MIHQQLKQLGLNETEINVYLAVIKHGRISPAQVAKVSKINRTTVYSVAKQLIAKGLISEDLGARPATLVALPPEELSGLLEKQEDELVRRRAAVDEIANQLKVLAQHAEYSVPKITFVEDDRVESHLYKRLPDWVESIMRDDPTKTWWAFQDPTFVEHYEEWLDYQWAQYAPPGFSVKALSNESDAERHMKTKQIPQRHIAFWEQAKDFTASTWVCGNYLILVYTNKRPHYLVEIHDRVMAHNFRELFKGIWASLA